MNAFECYEQYILHLTKVNDPSITEYRESIKCFISWTSTEEIELIEINAKCLDEFSKTSPHGQRGKHKRHAKDFIEFLYKNNFLKGKSPFTGPTDEKAWKSFEDALDNYNVNLRKDYGI